MAVLITMGEIITAGSKVLECVEMSYLQNCKSHFTSKGEEAFDDTKSSRCMKKNVDNVSTTYRV